ncbi:MAG: alternative ribosome rescue aminoacyl-tRNA hydrolase ArfB [Chitinophagales bacterium]
MSNLRDILKECNYKTARSRGAGGQNVNKVESKVTILWQAESSGVLSAEEKDLILKVLKAKLSKEGFISLSSEESRSQAANKEIVQEKLINLVRKALLLKKERKATSPSKQSKEKRLKVKRISSEIKQNRKKLKW